MKSNSVTQSPFSICSSLILALGICSCASRTLTPASPISDLQILGSFKTVANEAGLLKLEGADGAIIFIRRMDDLESSSALERANAQRNLLEQRLRPSIDPYFGQRKISKTCEPGSLPAAMNLIGPPDFLIQMSLFSTPQFVYGICNADVETMKSRISWQYCFKARALFDVREFVPANRDWPAAQFHCAVSGNSK